MLSTKSRCEKNCQICSNPTKYIFSQRILLKYDVKYIECTKCGFIQTETPYWLDEAYKSTITNLDIGLLSRADICLQKAIKLIATLQRYDVVNHDMKILDFAGGYGVFTRKMRDKGFDAFWQDDFCENIFAQSFEIDGNTYYDLITAFEVFEHVTDPVELVKRLRNYGKIIFFSTELVPTDKSKIDNWWYLTPTTGQHVSFYTIESLRILGEINNMVYFNSSNFHVFIPKEIGLSNPFYEQNSHLKLKTKIILKCASILKVPIKYDGGVHKNEIRESLLQTDFQKLLAAINK